MLSVEEACFGVAREEVGPGFDRENDSVPGDRESEGLPSKPPALIGSGWKRGETCTLTLEVGGGTSTELEPVPDVERASGGGE